MGAVGGGIGALAASFFGLPPQVGSAGGSMIEDSLFKKKKDKPSDGSAEAFSAVAANLLGNKMNPGGQEEGGDPFMDAINGFDFGGTGGAAPAPDTPLNTQKEIYTPPALMGFPSQNKKGINSAIAEALAARRGF